MSWVKDYLSFSGKERNALIILIVIMCAFIFLPDLYRVQQKPTPTPPEIKQALAKTQTNEHRDSEDDWQTQPGTVPQTKNTALFEFDPNTLDEAGFGRLGLPERTARTIINYRNKGGRFRKPEDLRKIYSLKKFDADRIIPYARVAGNETSDGSYHSKNVAKPYKNFTPSFIDVNTATVEEWKSLPGIGEVLSARIVKFRTSIGGFSSISQVGKTYGLRDSTFQLILPYLQLRNPAVNKVNINTAFEKELQECPAISPDVAKAIVIYRRQHGAFQSVADLKKIVFITDDMFEAIRGCVKTE